MGKNILIESTLSSSGNSLIPGTNGLLPQHTYCQYHKLDRPFSCKTGVKVSDDPFQNDGGNDRPPPENPQFDPSQYKGGPSPFEIMNIKIQRLLHKILVLINQTV